MNIIKSSEWEIIYNFISSKDVDTIKNVFDFLIEETLKYENGEASYPNIEFAISLALDRKPKEKQPIPILVPIGVSISDEETDIVVSPRTRKQIIRDSWINKFKEPEPEPEPEPEQKKPIIRRRIKKLEPDDPPVDPPVDKNQKPKTRIRKKKN